MYDAEECIYVDMMTVFDVVDLLFCNVGAFGGQHYAQVVVCTIIM